MEKTRRAPNEEDFAELLIDKKFVSRAECRLLLEKFQDDLFAVVCHLAERMPGRRQELGRFWGDYLGIVYLDLGRTIVKYELLDKLPEDFVRRNLIMPVYEFGGTITVAASKPEDEALMHQVENYLDAFISPAFAFPDQIQATLEIGYQSESGLAKLLERSKIQNLHLMDGPVSIDELKKLSGDEHIIEFTRGLMVLALKQRASDIHLEPGEHMGKVRFRVDGVLQEIFHLESALLPPINTRLKVMAGIDIAERRKPQDGSLKIHLAERSVDCRFSSMPTIYGEKVVMRILGAAGFEDVPGIEQLEFSRENEAELKRALGQPHGIFFATGPTGSGKTTSLYAMLHYLNRDGVNIITIEDPVEYRLPGLNQVQVNRAADVDFANALRASMRQDPDIILVGEIRDLETAIIATRAALTGHLVLTTLHTNSAIQALTRLIEIGVEPFLVAPSIIGVLGQRLLRRLCPKCKQEYKLSKQELDEYFFWEGDPEVYFYKAVGCERCNNIGFSGRLAIHELVLVDDDLRTLISQNAPISEVYRWAHDKGIRSMRYDGMKKVLRGLTSVDELDRVTVLE